MNRAECIAAGINPEAVARYERRLNKLLREMKADNIMLFGGGDASTLRPHRGTSAVQLLIVGDVDGGNIGGGAGAFGTHNSDDGLLRGEA